MVAFGIESTVCKYKKVCMFGRKGNFYFKRVAYFHNHISLFYLWFSTCSTRGCLCCKILDVKFLAGVSSESSEFLLPLQLFDKLMASVISSW